MRRLSAIFLIVALHVSNRCHIAARRTVYSCKDMQRENVDWYYAYKLPKLKDQGKTDDESEDDEDVVDDDSETVSKSFLYVDANDQSQWRRSPELINSEQSAVGATVAQVHHAIKRKNKNEHVFYALYNDAHPISPDYPKGRGAPGIYGHMKGLLVFDVVAKRGFWMIHSLPRFPQTQFDGPIRYKYPPNGGQNAQTFLCINLDISQLNVVGQLLLTALPSFYDYHVPPSFEQLYPELYRVITGSSLRFKYGEDNISLMSDIVSLEGTRFTSFSKHAAFSSELYSQFVAKELRVSMNVRTWLSGGFAIPSQRIGEIEVSNIVYVELDGYIVKNSKDHSKWAVSTPGEVPWICVGDINRQTTQFGRGGQTMCLRNARIWKRFYNLIHSVEVLMEKVIDKSAEILDVDDLGAKMAGMRIEQQETVANKNVRKDTFIKIDVQSDSNLLPVPRPRRASNSRSQEQFGRSNEQSPLKQKDNTRLNGNQSKIMSSDVWESPVFGKLQMNTILPSTPEKERKRGRTYATAIVIETPASEKNSSLAQTPMRANDTPRRTTRSTPTRNNVAPDELLLEFDKFEIQVGDSPAADRRQNKTNTFNDLPSNDTRRVNKQTIQDAIDEITEDVKPSPVRRKSPRTNAETPADANPNMTPTRRPSPTKGTSTKKKRLDISVPSNEPTPQISATSRVVTPMRDKFNQTLQAVMHPTEAGNEKEKGGIWGRLMRRSRSPGNPPATRRQPQRKESTNSHPLRMISVRN